MRVCCFGSGLHGGKWCCISLGPRTAWPFPTAQATSSTQGKTVQSAAAAGEAAQYEWWWRRQLIMIHYLLRRDVIDGRARDDSLILHFFDRRKPSRSAARAKGFIV